MANTKDLKWYEIFIFIFFIWLTYEVVLMIGVNAYFVFENQIITILSGTMGGALFFYVFLLIFSKIRKHEKE